MSHVPVLRRLTISLALGGLWSGAAWADPSTSTLSPIVIKAPVGQSVLQADLRQEKARLDAVPGGTNLIQPQEEVRLVTLRDALDYQPGLIVQDFFGGIDQPRLNIRGSGIQSNPVNRGVLLLQDGLPLNEADGSFVIGFLEPRNSSLISVRRGANALSASATTLGGELDFRSMNGTQGDTISVEGGSFGRLGLYAAKGFQTDEFDGRLAVSHDKADGYRHHSDSERTNVQGNIGFKRGQFENRTYLSYVDLKFDIPNVVPRERLYSDPRSVMGDYGTPQDMAANVYKRDPNRKATQFRLANRSYWGTEDFNQAVGLYWQTVDDTFTNPQVSSPTKGHTYGAQWQVAGREGSLDYRLALDWARSDMDRELYAVNPANGSRALFFGDYRLRAENRNALLGLSWNVAPQWTVVGDVKYSQAIRDARNRLGGDTLNQKWSYASPKLGVVWKPSEDLRVFANVSRSHEAPTYWEIISAEVPQPMNVRSAVTGLTELNVQKATTFELGGAGRLGSGESAVDWSLAVYRSNVKDELMAVSDASGASSVTFNYGDRTRHQGVEAGLSGSLPAPAAGRWDYRLSYTYSDFRFRGGEYEGNRIAGVPKHLLGAELMYRRGGWRFGPNVRWLASDTPTNHQNVEGTHQNAYAIWGFKVAYQHDKHWSAYLMADNIFDKTYASSYVIRRSASEAMPTYLAGNGRSFFGGVKYNF